MMDMEKNCYVDCQWQRKGKKIMPTVEIVSLDCNRLLPIKNSTLPFTVLQNRKLISHRSLFQEELNKINGTILHLGNKKFGRNTCFFSSELIDWASEI